MNRLPMFVLPMVLLPGEVQELRVFEPRYRQMLDDCLLDGNNFGLVLNDEFHTVNDWDGPRHYGCEAEIIHHETKGSNHFLQIIGRRRFTIKNVFEPALPPFSHPMLEPLLDPEGVDPDLQTIIEFIPEEVGHSKLYISAEVEYIEPQIESTILQQKQLQLLVGAVLNRIGGLLNIDGDMLFDWVNSSPIMDVIDNNPNSVYSVASLLIDDLESRQLILGSPDIDSAISELNLMFSSFGEEE
jgi:Lon protease-like protein